MVNRIMIIALALALSACVASASVAETDNTRYVTTTKLQLDNGRIIYSWLDEQVGVVCFGSWEASNWVQGLGVGISCVPLNDTNYALPIGGK